jgi:hypothetical protein
MKTGDACLAGLVALLGVYAREVTVGGKGKGLLGMSGSIRP